MTMSIATSPRASARRNQGQRLRRNLPVVQVTKDNVYEVVVVSGFQPYDDVYRDIPEADKPPKP